MDARDRELLEQLAEDNEELRRLLRAAVAMLNEASNLHYRTISIRDEILSYMGRPREAAIDEYLHGRKTDPAQLAWLHGGSQSSVHAEQESGTHRTIAEMACVVGDEGDGEAIAEARGAR